jgi:hypothetical protein
LYRQTAVSPIFRPWLTFLLALEAAEQMQIQRSFNMRQLVNNKIISMSSSSLSRSNSAARRPPSFAASANVSKSTTVTSTPLPPVTVKIEAAKKLAAYAAVDAYVMPDHKVIGIGSGTTIPYAVARILSQGEEVNADVSPAAQRVDNKDKEEAWTD